MTVTTTPATAIKKITTAKTAHPLIHVRVQVCRYKGIIIEIKKTVHNIRLQPSVFYV